MKILFTGASSFTGYWFVQALAEAGHDVWATFTAAGPEAYNGERGKRVHKLLEQCTPVWSCAFGGEGFMDLVRLQRWDVLCHHAADVTNYKSIDFDVGSALTKNTTNLRAVLEGLAQGGCNSVVLTGSVFEQQEGVGEEPLRAFSPYGLSKGLTSEVFRYWCEVMGIGLGKFVIPNPFGPYEEPRFTTYLAKTWLKGEVAGVKTPAYIRDNIHVGLLAETYRHFVEKQIGASGFRKLNPSGYVESQGAFATRFAEEMRRRTQLPCALELHAQVQFEEPKMRVNTDMAAVALPEWNEAQAWDELAAYYLENL